jgi:gliding motility-associated lipoprotein GldH
MQSLLLKMKILSICILPLTVISFTLLSCDENRVYEKNKEIKDGIWIKDQHISFDVLIEDTITPHNIYVNIRNSGMYPKSNLYMFITTKAPGGLSIRDTFECILADEKGNWLGDGLGDIWDNQIPFKSNVRFPKRGVYTFDYEQAMRVDKLPFILDAGLRIETALDQKSNGKR